MSSSLLYLAGPFATLIATALAYALGKAQGRSQARFEECVKVATGLRRRILILRRYYKHWVRNPSEETSAEVLRMLEELLEDYRAGLPWLEPRTVEKLEPLVSAMRYEGLYHYGILKTAGAGAQHIRDGATEGLREWIENDLGTLVDNLEDEVRRIAGMKAVWDRYCSSGRTPKTKEYQRGEIPEPF